MAVDCFMFFKKASGGNGLKIEGETRDDVYSKEKAIEVMSYSIGASNPINVGSSTGGLTAGKADFSGLSIMHQVDNASATMFTSLSLGDHFPEATLVVRRSGGKAANKYIQIDFLKIFVSSINYSASSGEEILMQSTNFEFGAIKYQYFAQKDDGTEDKPKEMVWSRILNKASFAI